MLSPFSSLPRAVSQPNDTASMAQNSSGEALFVPQEQPNGHGSPPGSPPPAPSRLSQNHIVLNGVHSKPDSGGDAGGFRFGSIVFTHANTNSVSPSNSMSPSRNLKLKGRCTVSLFFCFVIPSVIVATIFFTTSWVTLRTATVSSIDKMSNRFQKLAEQHLRRTVVDFLIQIATVSEMARGFIQTTEAYHHDHDHLHSFFADTMSLGGPFYLIFARADGLTITVRRDDEHGLIVGRRDPDCVPFSACANISYWKFADYNISGRAVAPPVITEVYDPRTRPWYEAVMANQAPSFTSPYRYLIGSRLGLTYGVPIFLSPGKIYGVVAVSYLFSALTDVLEDAREAIDTSGLLLLTSSDGIPLALSSTRTPTSQDYAALAALPMPRSNLEADATTMSLSSFGTCYVVHLSFVGKFIKDVGTTGINWRVFLALPKDDFFGIVDDQSHLEIGLFSGCIACYAIIIAIFFRLILVLPLRKLIGELQALKRMLLFQSRQSTFAATTSRFSELANLHQAVLDVIRAAQETCEQRSAQMTKMAETEQANEQTQRLMRAKEMFFAMMSHEMRTPLTACIGMAEVLLGTSLSPEQKECADAILFSGGMMLQLVNNILDFSKLEADRLVLENISFNLRECIEHVMQAIEIKAEEKRLELIADISADVPTTLVGDPTRLSQVFFNLLSNSVKFTQTGFVYISCIPLSEPTLIKFEVQDTGLGLSTEAIDNLFQPFIQAEASTTRCYGGTGLGLVITKRILHLMNSELTVQSEGPGRGSVFSFIVDFSRQTPSHRESGLSTRSPTKEFRDRCASSPSAAVASPRNVISPPLGVGSSSNPQIHPAASLASRSGSSGLTQLISVLVLDPLGPRLHAITEILRALHVKFYSAPNIDELKEFPVDDPAALCDFVILRLDNPAIETTKAISQVRGTHLPSSVARKIIFVIDMKVMPPTMAASENVAFLSKPVTLAKLKACLLRLSGSGGSGPSSSRPPLTTSPSSNSIVFSRNPTATFVPSASSSTHLLIESASMADKSVPSPRATSTNKHPRILIVDDVALNQRVLTLKLKQRGITLVDCANSGEHALYLIRNNPNVVYDLIFMDLMMPELDGIETTKHIKSLPTFSSVPIVGVTGNVTPESQKACLDAGMAAVLAKPFDTEKLFEALDTYVRVRPASSPRHGSVTPRNPLLARTLMASGPGDRVSSDSEAVSLRSFLRSSVSEPPGLIV